jgi:uncharacterized protein (DUF1015 family)
MFRAAGGERERFFRQPVSGLKEEKIMAHIRPFAAVHPAAGYEKRVAALPYDVVTRAEAAEIVAKEPLSFLHIDRAETWFDRSVDTYDPRVYEKAREVYRKMLADGIYVRDGQPAYYLCEMTMNGRVQTGIAALASVDDYLSGDVRTHEDTRPEKEQDRIRHIDRVNAQTGPILLACRAGASLRELMDRIREREQPACDFVSDDGIRHRVFRVDRPEEIRQITEGVRAAGTLYIADGHHRAASAVKVALMRRKENPGYTGDEEYNAFLSVIFPADELRIYPYNRAVKDLNGMTAEEFLARVQTSFDILRKVPAEEISGPDRPGDGRIPEKKGQIGMYLDGHWYTLRAKPEILCPDDPVASLDVSVLQDNLLGPVLGIRDPRTDTRIRFVEGLRGTDELMAEIGHGFRTAFSLVPTSMEELLRVADAREKMPPKSTCFEPKLRSGLLIHDLEERSLK